MDLNGGGFLNIQADEMKITDTHITAYFEGNLVAFLDISVVLTAYLSDKVVNK